LTFCLFYYNTLSEYLKNLGGYMSKTFLSCDKGKYEKKERLVNLLLKKKLPRSKGPGRSKLINRLALDVTTPEQIAVTWNNLGSQCGKKHFMKVFKKRADQFDAAFWAEVLNLFVDKGLAQLARTRLEVLNGRV